jgi:hypothetical protein
LCCDCTALILEWMETPAMMSWTKMAWARTALSKGLGLQLYVGRVDMVCKHVSRPALAHAPAARARANTL